MFFVAFGVRLLRAAEYDVPAGSGRELCADRWMNDLRLSLAFFPLRAS